MSWLQKQFKGDLGVWFIFLFLCLISIIEVFSASSTLSYKTGNHLQPILMHTVFLVIGAIVVWAVHRINYRVFQLIPFILIPISGILLVVVMLLGVSTNGANRWLEIAGVTFQPSELAKMAVVISTAFLLARNQENGYANGKAFKYILTIAVIFSGLIFRENFSTSIILFGVVYLMMFIGRIEFKRMLKLTVAIIIGALCFLALILLSPNEKPKTEEEEAAKEMLSPENANQEVDEKEDKSLVTTVLSRFTTWKGRIHEFTSGEEITPEKYDIDKNGQIAHARIAISKSNIIGCGPGNSNEREFLAQAFSDFIFAIIIEELGLLGGGFVLCLYIWLLVRAGRIAKKARGNFASFLVMGLALLLVMQAMVNMCVAVGLFPVTGQPLPLISKGGTSTIINCVYIGMILSVSRYTAKLEDEESEHLTQEPDGEINKAKIIAEEELDS